MENGVAALPDVADSGLSGRRGRIARMHGGGAALKLQSVAVVIATVGLPRSIATPELGAVRGAHLHGWRHQGWADPDPYQRLCATGGRNP